MQCWETRVGQEMYKLTMFDLLVNIAMLVLVEFPRRYESPCEQFVYVEIVQMNTLLSGEKRKD